MRRAHLTVDLHGNFHRLLHQHLLLPRGPGLLMDAVRATHLGPQLLGDVRGDGGQQQQQVAERLIP